MSGTSQIWFVGYCSLVDKLYYSDSADFFVNENVLKTIRKRFLNAVFWNAIVVFRNVKAFGQWNYSRECRLNDRAFDQSLLTCPKTA